MKHSEVTAEGIILGTICIIGGLLIDAYGGMFFVLLGVILGLFIFSIYLSWSIPRRIDSFIEKLDIHISALYAKSSYEQQEISEILDSIEEVGRVFRKSRILKYISYISHSKKLNMTLEGYANYIEKIILSTLLHLQKSLSEEIGKEKNNLKIAKSELNKNVTGNNELESISELQSARLDRQIEQFEELQRVLVKV